MAAYYNQNDVARLLLDFGAEVDARDNMLMTPLHIACHFGFDELAASLLDHGASVDAEIDERMLCDSIGHTFHSFTYDSCRMAYLDPEV